MTSRVLVVASTMVKRIWNLQPRSGAAVLMIVLGVFGFTMGSQAGEAVGREALEADSIVLESAVVDCMSLMSDSVAGLTPYEVCLRRGSRVVAEGRGVLSTIARHSTFRIWSGCVGTLLALGTGLLGLRGIRVGYHEVRAFGSPPARAFEARLGGGPAVLELSGGKDQLAVPSAASSYGSLDEEGLERVMSTGREHLEWLITECAYTRTPWAVRSALKLLRDLSVPVTTRERIAEAAGEAYVRARYHGDVHPDDVDAWLANALSAATGVSKLRSPNGRTYVELREEVDGFIHLVRSLNRSALGARDAGTDESWLELRSVRETMHNSVDHMTELAGKTVGEDPTEVPVLGEA